jgi:2-succinyl-6-hydroxy-2,4-cyclohexadiene-1-carboxylate synthase
MIKWNLKTIGNSKLPMMIFLHGFVGSMVDWLPACHHFSSDYQCLLLDLPGHGKTQATRSSDYTVSATARSLIRLLDSKKTGPSVLIGYSMGGRLALYLAVHYPDYFDKVILVSTSPGLQKKKDRLARQINDKRLADEMGNMTIEAFLQKWYDQPLFNSLKEHPKFEELLRQRLGNQVKNWPASLRGMGVGKQPSLWNKLEYLKMPVLILVGEKDQKFRYIAFQMKDLNPNFIISIIPQCGHVIHVENEDAFYSELYNFLRKRRDP